MEHSVCLQELRKLGAFDGSISMVRAFLERRCMTITLNGARCVAIQRGSPQGSVLGCFLYCATTQRLTSGRATGHRIGDLPRDPTGQAEPWVNDGGNMRPTKPFFYVDDTTRSKQRHLPGPGDRHLTTQVTREELDNLELGVVFTNLERNAEEIGIKINGKKSQLLVISPPNGCVTTATIRMAEGVAIELQDTLKLVGFTFGDAPGVASHVAGIKDKYRRKVWMLYHWRRSGLTGNQLLKLYCCHVRSIIEYCSAVYHSLLTRGRRRGTGETASECGQNLLRLRPPIEMRQVHQESSDQPAIPQAIPCQALRPAESEEHERDCGDQGFLSEEV